MVGMDSDLRQDGWRSVVAGLVIAGLVVSAGVASVLIDAPGDDLPGVALGSAAILVVERIVALFAAWLMVLVIVVRALAGDLPTEISGRGVRYADAYAASDATAESEEALDDLDKRVADLEETGFTLSRYAMLGEGDGHGD